MVVRICLVFCLINGRRLSLWLSKKKKKESKKEKGEEKAKQAFSLSIVSFFFCEVDVLPVDFPSHVTARTVSDGYF